MAPRPAMWALQRGARGVLLAVCMGLSGAAAGQEITGATYASPTDRYPHAVLGDPLEWASLRITVERSVGDGDGLFSGQTRQVFSLDAPENLVFEDIEPRLWDITGDGSPEVVVVQSHQQLGARLLVIGIVEGVPGFVAEVPFIGKRFRWLAPVGAADFDGDGRIEVAFVDRPHLAKVLRVFEWDGSALVLDTEIAGLTNHRIGEDFISGGVRDCGDGPELITANGDWSDVMMTSFDGPELITANGDWSDVMMRSFDGAWWTRSLGAFSPDALQAALLCER